MNHDLKTKDRKTWEEMIAKAFYWKCVDEQRDEKLKKLSLIHSFMDGIEMVMGKEIVDWLLYLLYEVRMGEEWRVKGQEYDFGQKGEALRFFEENYPSTPTK